MDPVQAVDPNRGPYDFRTPMDRASALAVEPVLVRVTETRAFRRLRSIRFLGGIDYLRVPSPNGRLGSRRYTRQQHSLGVTRLALLYCQAKQIVGAERQLIGLAALLHDIGHAPLSHSLEPLFRREFGMDHHRASEALVTGRVSLGHDLYAVLRDAEVDVERLVAVMSGREPGHDGFFAGPINFDTIEGILRTQTYEKPAPRVASPETVVTAALRRRDEEDRIVVDEFWLYKNMVYRFIINAEAGLLADAVCQSFMRRHLDRFSADDVFRSEEALFRKLPGLRALLTSDSFAQEARHELDAVLSVKARRFVVDPAGDFFARQDIQRYRQSKTESRIELGTRDGPGHEVSRDLFDDDAAIDRARVFSDARLDVLRARIPALVPAGAVVVACGSYARREASPASDFDYFTILPASCPPPSPVETWEAELRQAIAAIVEVEPAKDGAFGKLEAPERMVRNIGGPADDNQKLTRRMLFLLEGAPLSAPDAARQVRLAILRRYVEAGRDAPLALFLLNDIIRYYRTMAVDYEFKTTEGDRPKPWGLRNVKLMFSRKLLYAAGLFSVADAAGGTPGSRVDRLERLLDMRPIDRLSQICGALNLQPALASYDRFLSHLADPETRRRLEALTLADQDDPLFRRFQAEGQTFDDQILALFRATFEPAHPIHRCLVL